MPALIFPFTSPAPSTAFGISLQAYRRDLAATLGLFEVDTVTTLATGGEAARLVLVDALRDDERDDDHYSSYGDTYAYVTTGAQAGEQRRILDRGYEGPLGGLRVSRPFAAPLAASDQVEFSAPLPAKTIQGIKGLNAIVNEALERCRVGARLSIVGNGTLGYSLNAYPWLREDAIDGIFDRRGWMSAQPLRRESAGFEVAVNGADLTLLTDATYSSAETFELSVLIEGGRWVKTAGTWAYTTTGLVNDTDEASVPLHWARAFGMVKALQHLKRMTLRDHTLDKEAKGGRLATLEDEIHHWALAAVGIERSEFPRRATRRATPIVSIRSFSSAMSGGLT